MEPCGTSLSSLSVVSAIWKFAQVLTATVSISWRGLKSLQNGDVTLGNSMLHWPFSRKLLGYIWNIRVKLPRRTCRLQHGCDCLFTFSFLCLQTNVEMNDPRRVFRLLGSERWVLIGGGSNAWWRHTFFTFREWTTRAPMSTVLC